MKKIIWIIVIVVVLVVIFFALNGQDNDNSNVVPVSEEVIDDTPVFSERDGVVDDVLNNAFAGFGEIDGELNELDAQFDTVGDGFVDGVNGIGDNVFGN